MKVNTVAETVVPIASGGPVGAPGVSRPRETPVIAAVVAVDHGPEGVRCNAVAPGWIGTELNTAFIDSLPDPQAFRRGIGWIHPVARTGSAEEVAALVAFLAAEESGFVTGQVYTVDGGRMAQLSLPG